MTGLKCRVFLFALLFGAVGAAVAARADEPRVSDASRECIDCHRSFQPALVDDWQRSRHARTLPADALKKPKLQRRISAESIPDELAGVVVGCAECHTRNPAAHKDTFGHNDKKVHLLVTPKDCASCHPQEAEQFDQNLMAWARTNLTQNKVYQDLVKAVDGTPAFSGGRISLAEPDALTQADSCFHCHGTAVEVQGMEKRDTDQGEMEFPVLSGWPNQGVGRMNTDGSRGSCSACHSRHQFSIEAARKPYTCSQCHKGPDVPAYKAYEVSKHGNIFSALRGEWKFNEVPWTVGKDFTAPTCAACHVSLIVNSEGETVVQRTHRMNDRLPWRILGLIYAHPHPKSPDTSVIVNADGLQLATTLGGEPASKFLIDKDELDKRRDTLQKVCLSCHTRDWVNGHWQRLERAIATGNASTLAATEIVRQAWKHNVADDKESLFDEAIEKQWVEHWLFFANSTRFASAMMGADYGVFDNGRWFMAKNLQQMLDRLKFLLGTKKAEP